MIFVQVVPNINDAVAFLSLLNKVLDSVFKRLPPSNEILIFTLFEVIHQSLHDVFIECNISVLGEPRVVKKRAW